MFVALVGPCPQGNCESATLLPPQGPALPSALSGRHAEEGAAKDMVNYESTIRESVAQQFAQVQAQATGKDKARDMVNYESTIRESVAQQFAQMQAQLGQQHDGGGKLQDMVNFESTVRASTVQQFEQMQARAAATAATWLSQQEPSQDKPRDMVNFESTIRESIVQQFEQMQAQISQELGGRMQNEGGEGAAAPSGAAQPCVQYGGHKRREAAERELQRASSHSPAAARPLVRNVMIVPDTWLSCVVSQGHRAHLFKLKARRASLQGQAGNARSLRPAFFGCRGAVL